MGSGGIAMENYVLSTCVEVLSRNMPVEAEESHGKGQCDGINSVRSVSGQTVSWLK
jgi:hypothetical protein